MIIIIFLLIFAGIIFYSIMKPKVSRQSLSIPLGKREKELLTISKAHVRNLSSEIGNRSIKNYSNLEKAESYIEKYWTEAGLLVKKEEFLVDGLRVANILTEFKGEAQPDEIILIGAHYDSVGTTCPGANDNCSGVAALLELAVQFRLLSPQRTIRFIAFVNEELPYYKTEFMGSDIHARNAKKRNEKIIGMMSLETIGYYSDEPNSQKYPFPYNFILPDRGDFIAFIGNIRSIFFLRRVASTFRSHTKFPLLSVAALAFINGISWSDHWAFWKQGYKGLMITDTAPFRYPHYHLDTDTFDKLDYERMVKVICGLEFVIKELAKAGLN